MNKPPLFLRVATLVATATILLTGGAAQAAPQTRPVAAKFDPNRDLISLHYDHAPDRDDGQSAAADRTILQTRHDPNWIQEHVLAVSGAYGENAKRFRPESDAVMNAVWTEELGGWIAAHEDRQAAVAKMTARWRKTLDAGGDVWVKEGGQSDLTAAVVQRLQAGDPKLDTTKRIHVVQHSGWNERQTTDAALAYTKKHTDYIRIKDANRFLNKKGGDAAFQKAGLAHPVFGPAWRAAFEYYPPKHRLDFSDTGELMHMLGLGEVKIDAFRRRFLEVPAATRPAGD